MATKNKPSEATINGFLQDVQKIFQTDLLSVVLYGSAARGDYFAKKSDLNFLVILTESGMQKLADAFGFVKKWTKRGIAIPLFMTKEYIDSSLDSFPIEFLNLKLHHKILFGQDLLSPLEIPDSHLRLQCEEQLKSKLLHLWEDFLETRGKRGSMRRLLIETIPTLSSIFSGLIVMKKADVPGGKEDIIINTARLYGLDETVFQRVLDVRMGSAKLTQKETQSLLQSYISEMSKLADIVDQWVN